MNGLRVLVLTFYYEPDLCAGSFRATSFIEVLKSKLNKFDSADVLTTMPNRYHTYDKEALETEIQDNITIKRFFIPEHKSGIVDQSKSFYTFYRKSLSYVRMKDYDLVFATSSRLFTAFLGYRIARKKKLPLYLDIRDLFVDTIKSVFENRRSKFLIPIPLFRFVEKRVFTYAYRINIVSDGFREYINRLVPESKISFFSNGIDDSFINTDFSKTKETKTKIITYAGNIGDGQGLHKIIPEIAQLLGDSYKFLIIGAGGMKNMLEKALEDAKVDNVELMNPLPRKEIVKFYQESDYLFLHLNNYDAFTKVLPSKIFEYGATGKPVIAGVNGYSREFIHQYLPNWLIFNSSDIDDFKNKFDEFKFNTIDPSGFIKKFQRRSIMENFVNDVLSLTMRSPRENTN